MTTEKHSLEQLADRLTKLERQNRRLKQLGGLLLAVAGLILLMAAQREKVTPTEARKWVLQTAEGKDRARLEIARGEPLLRFMDDDGRDVATVGVRQGTLLLQLWDGGGHVQTGLALQRDGVALICHDGDGLLQTGRNAILQTAGVFPSK
jgi:hypothetical protein